MTYPPFANSLPADPIFHLLSRRLPIGTDRGEIHVRSANDGTTLWKERCHDGEVWAVAFSPDGKLVASGATALKLWDARTLKELATLDGHKAPIMGIAFSPDGKTLATASLDHTVKLWSVEIRQEVATLKGHRGPVSGLAFSRDGTLLVSSSQDKTIRLWRAVAEEAVRTGGD